VLHALGVMVSRETGLQRCPETLPCYTTLSIGQMATCHHIDSASSFVLLALLWDPSRAFRYTDKSTPICTSAAQFSLL